MDPVKYEKVQPNNLVNSKPVESNAPVKCYPFKSKQVESYDMTNPKLLKFNEQNKNNTVESKWVKSTKYAEIRYCDINTKINSNNNNNNQIKVYGIKYYNPITPLIHGYGINC